MDTVRIADLLRPFTSNENLPPKLLEQLQLYLDLLLRWNARINLTAVRDPEQIVTRHFGESLFAARLLLSGNGRGDRTRLKPGTETGLDGMAEALPFQSRPGKRTLIDVGSGAGFPGIPMKLYRPELEVTLIESQNKKATFLREVIRVLDLNDAEVFCGRAEQCGKTADLVTLRAVEQFERVLPTAADLATLEGTLCLLIGASQISTARRLLGTIWTFRGPIAVPLSADRLVLVGSRSRASVGTNPLADGPG